MLEKHPNKPLPIDQGSSGFPVAYFHLFPANICPLDWFVPYTPWLSVEFAQEGRFTQPGET